ncbi:MAG TPA: hypothetical protein VFS22_06345 [Flavisolibacter sp.]|nr:hypothetical protein [Flavisolibacter sp.]
MSQKRFKKAQDKALPWEAHYLTPTIPEDGAYDVDDLKRGWEDLKADKTPLALII